MNLTGPDTENNYAKQKTESRTLHRMPFFPLNPQALPQQIMASLYLILCIF